jgi:hypothetical protein
MDVSQDDFDKWLAEVWPVYKNFLDHPKVKELRAAWDAAKASSEQELRDLRHDLGRAMANHNADLGSPAAKPNIDPWPDLPTAERDFTFGQLWVLGSMYADLLEAASVRTPPVLAHPTTLPRAEFMRLSVEEAMQVLERYPNMRALLQGATTDQPRDWPMLSTELRILLYSVYDYIEALRAAPAEDDVLAELRRVAGGEPPDTLREIVILFAKSHLMTLDRSTPSQLCARCGKLKLLPGVGAGIAPEGVCRC